MVERPSPLLLLVSLLAGLAIAPAPQHPPHAPDQSPQPTFHVSEELSTIDAIVTDKDGHHVRDLEPADFEVRQHGKRLGVRQVVYIDTSLQPTGATAATQSGEVAPVATSPPASPLA